MSETRKPYAYMWSFQVKAGREAEFESLYGPRGGWARFFGGSSQYLKTELLRDLEKPRRYCTIDYWADPASHQRFCEQHAQEFSKLDSLGENLTESETPAGRF